MRALMALLLAGTALAGPKAPDCVPSRERAVEIARTRGKLIFLTVLVDNDSENRAVVDRVFRDRAFLKIAEEFVVLYANKDEEHGKVKVKGPDGKPVLRCRDCPSITCADHIDLALNYSLGFFEGHGARTPIHFVIDAEERVVETIANGTYEQGYDHVPAKQVVRRLEAVLDEHGRGLSEEQYARMQELWSEAKAARARDKVTLELDKLVAILAFERDVEGVRAAKARLGEIDAVAAEERKKVDAMVAAEQWEEALDALAAIAETYAGTPTAEAAKEQRAELEGRREVERLLEARDLYEGALKLKERKKLELARKRLEKCVRLYPETKYGALARAELERFQD